MKADAGFALYFAAGLLVSMLLASTISVYGLNQYEPAWGYGGSVQVLWWLSLAAAVCAFFSVAIAGGWLAPDRTVSATTAFGSGVAFSLLTIAGLWSLARFGWRSGPIAVCWIVVGPAVLGVTVLRKIGKATS